MARPVTISDDDILEAARRVFLEHGIRATTAEVARRAGVSEGSVFKRWRTKEELFHACMRGVRLEDVGWVRDLQSRVGKGTVREQMEAIGLAAYAFFVNQIPLHMMSWSNRGDTAMPTGWHDGDPPPIRSRKALAGYFDAERKLGRIHSSDVDVLARTFLGSIYNFASLEIMLAGHDPQPLAGETYVRGLVDILLTGVGEPRRGWTPPTQSPIEAPRARKPRRAR